MTTFLKRQWYGSVLLFLLSVLLGVIYWVYAPTVHRFTYFSGWLLFVMILVLSAYNARKKLPFLPLGTSETWLQIHIYLGLLTIVVFTMHIRFRVPTGWFEGMLAWLYVLVTLSGIVGLVISRALPKRMTTRGGEVVYERIPSIRRSLQEQAEELALKSIPQAQSPTIADFYIRHLKDFFESSQNFWLHLLEIRRPLNMLQNKIVELDRFLNQQEREMMNKIAALVRQKDGLDYQFALQSVLKAWLFVHIPLTYSLLIFALLHLVLVYAFSGGTQ